VRARAAALLLVAAAAATGGAFAEPLLAPLAAAQGTVPLPWRAALLPGQKKPQTHFELVELDGVRVLKVEANASYGNLLHPLVGTKTEAHTLAWRWRLERAVQGADLRQKSGDDTAVKLCVLFDHAIARVPFMERQLLRMARAQAGEDLPAATLCYVWDAALATGTVLHNAYTHRLRWLVLQGSGSAPGEWHKEQRDLRADFLLAFGDEAQTMPPISAVLVGADADNTGGHSLAYVADLTLE
jgi:hypothetical protein